MRTTLAFWFAVLTAAPGFAGQVDTSASLDVEAAQTAFGFSNESGSRILALDPVFDPPALDRAVCSTGASLPIFYVGPRDGAFENTQRAAATHFDRVAGHE